MQVDFAKINSNNLTTITDNALLAEAEALMAKENLHHLLVVNSNKTVVGVLSRNDFLPLRRVGLPVAQLKVRDFMSSACAVERSNPVKKLAQLFLNKKISSALVTENNSIVGIITSEEIMQLLVLNVEVMA